MHKVSAWRVTATDRANPYVHQRTGRMACPRPTEHCIVTKDGGSTLELIHVCVQYVQEEPTNICTGLAENGI